MCDRMNEEKDHKESLERSMIITKDSLRPPCKRQRTRSGRCDTPQAKEEQIKVSQPEVHVKDVVKTKCRRQWEQWGEDDQEIFFQGLAEYGKDYGKIWLLMKKKLKSKGEEESKTKEQIRHFYHRTWTKILKTLMLQHEPENKKAYRREIHYMLCLGELRKKGVQGLGQKVLKQLDELVTKGSTYIRHKGRNVRLRPPNRFLKKLYRDVNSIPDITLPKHVNIELLPNTNTSFNYVQKHAFNPRLRFTNVNINVKLSEVFDLFNKRFTDLYTNEQLELFIYPIYSHMCHNAQLFAEKLANAEVLLENFIKRQDMPIILENVTKSPEKVENVSEEEESHEFPKIFGKCNNSDEKDGGESTVKPFYGYWTCSSAEEVYLRTLYVALGQLECLKFKYEWKLLEEEKVSFSFHARNFLTNCFKEGNRQKKEEQKQLKRIIPKTTNSKKHIHVIQKSVVPGIISGSDGRSLNNKQFALPGRPRPGRKRSYPTQQGVPVNRIIVPRMNGTSRLLNNAVAVNLIPQPPQLVQYANLPPDSIKLINSGTTNSITCSSLSNGCLLMESPSSNVSESSTASYEEVVVDEGQGFTEHFKSLANILAAASLKQNSNSESVVQMPIIVNDGSVCSRNFSNLDWLNEQTPELTMTSFLNVCEMQALQEKQKQEMNGVIKIDDDPTLPIVHSGDTSHGAFDGLTFDLSNQGVAKSNVFTL